MADGFRITELWAFLAIHADGDEGVVAHSVPGGMMLPMIAADRTRLELLRPTVEAIVKASGQEIVLARFTAREDVERVEAKG